MQTVILKKNRYYTILSLLLLLFFYAESSAQAEKAALQGSFLLGSSCNSWSDERWQQEFDALKAAGMQYLVFHSAAYSSPEETIKTYYPSSLPNTELVTGGVDVVDACLKNAESAGIKVFLGINFNDKWWPSGLNDSTWLFSQMEIDNDICDELWDKYKSSYPNTFYGWYWTYEVANSYIETTDQQYVLTKAMNMQLDHLTNEGEKLPFMWCPFVNSKYGNPQLCKTSWTNVFAGLHTAQGDIFCPQDCVGAGGLVVDEIEVWFSALRDAVDSKEGLVMWSDVETFSSYNNGFIAATFDRIVSQMRIEQPYVDNYISWNYCYYDSPYKANSGFHTTYLDYLENDTLETSAPEEISEFTAEPLPDGSVFLNWDEAADNIGICGYNIYRNGEIIMKKQVPLNNTDNTAAPTNAVDVSTIPNTEYSYRAEAYDFAGNVSQRTPQVSLTTKNCENISTACSYSVSAAPSESYPDPNGKKLTDNKFAVQAYFADPNWVGFNNIDSLNVVIDLQLETDVMHFTTDYLLDPQPAIYLPEKIKVSVSNDNVNYTFLGELRDITPDNKLASIHNYFYSLSQPLKARYVKFTTIAANSAWLFVDEFQILRDITTNIESPGPGKSLPYKFGLYNNYPNPFNPSTNIRFTLAKSGNVSLKIYNGRGQLVKSILNNVYMDRGSYKYNVNISNLASNVYFYKLVQGNRQITKKMIFLK